MSTPSLADGTIDILQRAMNALRIVAYTHHEECHNGTVPLASCPAPLCKVAAEKLAELDAKIEELANGTCIVSLGGRG